VGDPSKFEYSELKYELVNFLTPIIFKVK